MCDQKARDAALEEGIEAGLNLNSNFISIYDEVQRSAKVCTLHGFWGEKENASILQFIYLKKGY